ncbi:hypothetical protein HMI54_015510 [Coelomomyces lativittatus]|nr:hypothetical protein HMI55_005096 [Coelomomyces lativittatus]KAJ1499237.1 hypothetical protein HMI56_004504 [Coelomomyces lativittatus]KAJ1512750.1 hypothetical protein HMI54_015510 [Coelomomyces lativittatus]
MGAKLISELSPMEWYTTPLLTYLRKHHPPTSRKNPHFPLLFLFLLFLSIFIHVYFFFFDQKNDDVAHPKPIIPKNINPTFTLIPLMNTSIPLSHFLLDFQDRHTSSSILSSP